MRRDMNLIRLLLLEIEGAETPDLSAYDEKSQLYHTYLLIDAELVRGSYQEDQNGEIIAAVTLDLTWKGHEFLDLARNPKRWKKVLEKVKDGGFMLDLLIALLKKAALEAIGE